MTLTDNKMLTRGLIVEYLCQNTSTAGCGLHIYIQTLTWCVDWNGTRDPNFVFPSPQAQNPAKGKSFLSDS